MTALHLRTVLVEPPEQPAWELADLKRHLVVESDEDDDLIKAYAATAEEALGGQDTIYQRVWTHATWRDFWPDFTRSPVLRLAPVHEIARITYINTAGTEMLIKPEAYYLMPDVMGARLGWSDAYALPGDVARRPDAVRIDYVAGYGPLGKDAPQRVRQAIRMLVGHWYRHREDVVIAAGSPVVLPKAVEFLMEPLRRFGVEAWDSVNVPCLGPGGAGDPVLGVAVDLE
ncbi:head-tail connector protein [Hyphomonas sp.]|uniref:head-tail connector protein n=1 Tax=Hyphomonas sp. TaxID=87 RepID=UPI0025C4EA84|nr:head-tail connector protein [Hyphomonas sp.]